AADDRRASVGRPPMRDQSRRELTAMHETHHRHQRHALRTNRLERRFQRLAGLTSQHQESRRQTAMRHRNAGKFWRSDSGRHARDDLEPNTCVRKDERFFSTPAKDERVATLEPDHAFALPSRANHQPVYRLLLHAGAPGALADTETL